MKKNERGSVNFRSDGNTEIVRWNDNSFVTIGSNRKCKEMGRRKRETKYSAACCYCCILTLALTFISDNNRITQMWQKM